MATAAELAALSASSNLTFLSLGESEYCNLAPSAYDSWFPPGHQCPYLEYLDMGEWVLGNTAAVQRTVSACPGLKHLELYSTSRQGDRPHSTCVTASLQALTSITALTCLRVDGLQPPVGVCVSPAVISAWSQMTSLQQLELKFQADWWPSHMQDVLRLTQQRSLRVLYLREYTEDNESPFLLDVESQVGSPPDVWQQLPSALWTAAIGRQESRIRELQQQQQQKQEEVAALRQQAQAGQAQIAQLQGQVASLQATVAALLERHG